MNVAERTKVDDQLTQNKVTLDYPGERNPIQWLPKAQEGAAEARAGEKGDHGRGAREMRCFWLEYGGGPQECHGSEGLENTSRQVLPKRLQKRAQPADTLPRAQ